MRAVTYDRYGGPDVLELRDVAEPAVADDAVLIRVHSASVNRSDWETLTGRPFYVRVGGAGFVRPKSQILGSDVAGTVESVGANVTQFSTGDEVFGDIMWHGGKAFAEYVSVPESAPIVPKPAALTFEQAAALPQGAVLALQGLGDGRPIKTGDRVLIKGAGGGAGSFAIQLAQSMGAEVTGVDSGAKSEAMRSYGADHIIDYAQQDYTSTGERYDRILDFVGSRSIRANRRALRPDGVYRMVGGSGRRILGAFVGGWLRSRRGEVSMGMLMGNPNGDDLTHLADLVTAGELRTPIHKTYELAETPQALRDLGDGLVIGKAVITI